MLLFGRPARRGVLPRIVPPVDDIVLAGNSQEWGSRSYCVAAEKCSCSRWKKGRAGKQCFKRRCRSDDRNDSLERKIDRAVLAVLHRIIDEQRRARRWTERARICKQPLDRCLSARCFVSRRHSRFWPGIKIVSGQNGLRADLVPYSVPGHLGHGTTFSRDDPTRTTHNARHGLRALGDIPQYGFSPASPTRSVLTTTTKRAGYRSHSHPVKSHISVRNFSSPLRSCVAPQIFEFRR